MSGLQLTSFTLTSTSLLVSWLTQSQHTHPARNLMVHTDSSLFSPPTSNWPSSSRNLCSSCFYSKFLLFFIWMATTNHLLIFWPPTWPCHWSTLHTVPQVIFAKGKRGSITLLCKTCQWLPATSTMKSLLLKLLPSVLHTAAPCLLLPPPCLLPAATRTIYNSLTNGFQNMKLASSVSCRDLLKLHILGPTPGLLNQKF